MKVHSGRYLLMLIGLLVSSRAFSQRQCGAPPKNNMLYESMPSEWNGPDPRVARISKQNNQEVIWVTRGSGPFHSERSEEHTSELQSRLHLVCRLLLEKKKKTNSR